MKSVVLVVEHRTCSCGATFTSPNPKLLVRSKVQNLKRADYLRPLSTQVPINTPREILHVEVSLDNCPICFEHGEFNQMEFWPTQEEMPISYYEGIKTAREVEEKAEVERKKNPYNLNFF